MHAWQSNECLTGLRESGTEVMSAFDTFFVFSDSTCNKQAICIHSAAKTVL